MSEERNGRPSASHLKTDDSTEEADTHHKAELLTAGLFHQGLAQTGSCAPTATPTSSLRAIRGIDALSAQGGLKVELAAKEWNNCTINRK